MEKKSDKCHRYIVSLCRGVTLKRRAEAGVARRWWPRRVWERFRSRDFPSPFEHNLLRVHRIADRHMPFLPRPPKARGLNFYKSVAPRAPRVLPSAR